MTSTIYDYSGSTSRVVSQSHDLRAILRGASLYGGVRRISVQPANLPHSCNVADIPAYLDGGAEVTILYHNGYIGETLFVSFSHAVEWAFERSQLSGRRSFFGGCEVFAPGADLDAFTRHYLIAALWSSTASNGEPLDDYFDIDDIGPNARAAAISDCRAFQHGNRALLKKAYAFYTKAYAFYTDNGNAAHPDAGSPEACAGHDFWLTRNRHGAGFWDRGMGKPGEQLTEAAHMAGEVNIDEYDMIDPTAGGAIEPVNEE